LSSTSTGRLATGQKPCEVPSSWEDLLSTPRNPEPSGPKRWS
jgi:hypothetical protein